MKVNFSLEHPKNTISTIRARISYAGKQYRISTGESIKSKLFRNGRVRASPEATAINNKLLAIESAISQTVLFFKQDFKVPSQQEFTKKVYAFLKGNNAIEVKQQDQLLLPFIHKYIHESNVSLSTKKTYVACLNILEEFANTKKKELSFNDINNEFELKFKTFLIKKNFSKNYISLIIKKLKLFMRQAHTTYKLHSNIDYMTFRTDKETADSIVLSMTELNKIHNLKLTEEIVSPFYKTSTKLYLAKKIHALYVAKNKFLIGACYAMRVSDYNRISSYNIKDNCIIIMPKKGSNLRKPEPIKLPMHPIVKDILKSGFNPETPMSKQNLNTLIKEVCKIAGINEYVSIFRTEGGVLKEHRMPKYAAISTHTARRTGATNMYLSKVPIDLIMACTGHLKRDTCEKYIKASTSEILKQLGGLEYFRNENMTVKNTTMNFLRHMMQEKSISISMLAEQLNIPEDEIINALANPSPWQKAALFFALK